MLICTYTIKNFEEAGGGGWGGGAHAEVLLFLELLGRESVNLGLFAAFVGFVRKVILAETAIKALSVNFSGKKELMKIFNLGEKTEKCCYLSLVILISFFLPASISYANCREGFCIS